MSASISELLRRIKLKQKTEDEIFYDTKYIKNVKSKQNLLYMANLYVAKKEVKNFVCGNERKLFCWKD